MSREIIAAMFQDAFSCHGGVYTGDGVAMALHLQRFCTSGLAAPRTDNTGKIDATSAMMAQGRFQVWNEISDLMMVVSSEGPRNPPDTARESRDAKAPKKPARKVLLK